VSEAGSPTAFTVSHGGVTLAGEATGSGPAVVLLHGLTATRRYVVMGSRLLERAGARVVAYDARGHGRSSPAPDPRAYEYADLAGDLRAVLDELGIEQALLAGASMGAHTIARFALESPGRVAALALITPAYDPAAPPDVDRGPATAPPGDAGQLPAVPESQPPRDPLAQGLRARGVEGFVDAYDFGGVPPAWRETVEQVIRQRLSLHEHPRAVADALEVVPRSRPFAELAQLAAIGVPALVIASRDEVDPGHPLALAERYAAAIPGATLRVEDGGPPVRSPIAWQGGQLSKELIELACRASLLHMR
jgi:pimeloyl-ACP methyl ester carboxylesterase